MHLLLGADCEPVLSILHGSPEQHRSQCTSRATIL